MGPISIKLMRSTFPVSFMNFFRYLSALLILWPYIILSGSFARSAPLLKSSRHFSLRILAVSLTLFFFQSAYTLAVFLIEPGLVALLQRANIIFSLLLAVALFPEERSLIRRPGFLLGTLLAVAGILLIVPVRGAAADNRTLPGVLVMMVSASSWALTGALIKKWFSAVPTLFTMVLVETAACPLFLLTHLVSGGPLFLAGTPFTWSVLIVSGLIAFGVGYMLYYRTVPILGLAVSSIMGLSIPLVTGIVSFLLFGEQPTLRQAGGGVLLLAGCYQAIRTHLRRSVPP